MNKVILMGRLTKDPELRHTTTDKVVCQFRIAVEKRFVRQEDREKADFFPIVAWGKTAEFCGKYFHKGQRVAVVGRLQNNSWNDEQGNRRTITEVIADEVYFADSKKSDYTSDGYDQKQTSDGDFFPSESEDELPF